jgi:hypothetical protein
MLGVNLPDFGHHLANLPLSVGLVRGRGCRGCRRWLCVFGPLLWRGGLRRCASCRLHFTGFQRTGGACFGALHLFLDPSFTGLLFSLPLPLGLFQLLLPRRLYSHLLLPGLLSLCLFALVLCSRVIDSSRVNGHGLGLVMLLSQAAPSPLSLGFDVIVCHEALELSRRLNLCRAD